VSALTRTGHTCLTFAASAETGGQLLVFADDAIEGRRRRNSQGARVTGADPSEQLIVALHSHVGALSNIGKATRDRKVGPMIVGATSMGARRSGCAADTAGGAKRGGDLAGEPGLRGSLADTLAAWGLTSRPAAPTSTS